MILMGATSTVQPILVTSATTRTPANHFLVRMDKAVIRKLSMKAHQIPLTRVEFIRRIDTGTEKLVRKGIGAAVGVTSIEAF
jgi:hypothetical protein